MFDYLEPNYIIIPRLKASKLCLWVVKRGLNNIPKKKTFPRCKHLKVSCDLKTNQSNQNSIIISGRFYGKSSANFTPRFCLKCDIMVHKSALQKLLTINPSNHRRRYVRKGVVRNFAKFTGKHQCQISF